MQVDDISVGIDIGFENTVNSMTKEFTLPVPVLHGAPVESDVCVEWHTIEELKPISSYIINYCTDWSVDALLQTSKTIHLIEIDLVASDSVYTHVTLNNKVCHAKLDTGAQINVMTESLFKCTSKINKLPLYPKSDMKLVGYGNRNIEYIGTTLINVAHLNQTKIATFYVTKLNDDKVILGLHLCIDLLLLSIHCDNKCQCKAHAIHMRPRLIIFLLVLTYSKHNKIFLHQFQLVPRLILWCQHHQECDGSLGC